MFESDLFSRILEFLAALLIPASVAAPLISNVIDLFFKRIKWWNGAWTVRANIVLNLLASGLVYWAQTAGYDNDMTRAFELSNQYIVMLALVVFGVGTTWLSHKYFQTIGVAPSTTRDTSVLGVSKG
jgi:hypothetical protein